MVLREPSLLQLESAQAKKQKRLILLEKMDKLMLGKMDKALDNLEVQIGFENEDDKVQTQVNKAMDKLQEQEAEMMLQEKLNNIRNVADAICVENQTSTALNPFSYLFFTQYGGEVTAKKLLKDHKTDIDFRLVCFTAPSKDEYDFILERLQTAAGDLPVELFISEVKSYSKGIVGETGTLTPLEVAKMGLDPELINTRLDNPNYFAMYNFATTRLFTNRNNTLLAFNIEKAIEKNIELGNITKEENYTLDDLTPETILKKITLTKEGAIEWAHEYLIKFVFEYKKMNKLSIEGKLTKEVLAAYLQRLSKYIIRIAFGIATKDADFEKLKTLYIKQLNEGIHADHLHLDIIFESRPSWLNPVVSELLTKALNLRAYLTNSKDFKNLSLEDLQQKQQEMENVLLFIAQQAGQTSRKKEFDSIYDFLSILTIKNVLKSKEIDSAAVENIEVPAGEEFISKGDSAEEMFIIPRTKTDGTLNGKLDIIVHNILIYLERHKPIIGELGILADQPRSVSIKAHDNIEAIILSKSFLKELFSSKAPNSEQLLLKSFLHLTVDTESPDVNTTEIFNKVLLIFSFLNYFLNEFIQYLYEQVEQGYVFSEELEKEKSAHMLSEYKVDNFAEIISYLCTQNKFESTKISEPVTLFSNGDADNGSFYVITNVGETGGVKISFPGDVDNQNDVILKEGDVVGESSLLHGEKFRNYTATLLPGTEVEKINVAQFKEVTSNTDMMHVEIKNGREFPAITGIELMIHLSLLCLDRLQKIKVSI